MSRKANPTLIGVFVIVASALALAALVLFGGGQFLNPTTPYVLYFGGSVSGLNVGAPVSFRGVEIGTVTRVEVELDGRDASIRTPVFIEIDRDKFRTVGGDVDGQDIDRVLDLLIERGLRAQLLAESLVTGLKVVEFDFFPTTPLQLADERSDPRELPTVPSDIEQLTAELKGLPIAELADSTAAAMAGLELLVRSPAIQELPGDVQETLADLRSLVANVDQSLAQLTTQLQTTAATADTTLHRFATLTDPEGPVITLTSDLEKTSAAMRSTLAQADEALVSLRGTMEGTGDMQYELTVALREVSAAARSMRLLAEALEENPESLLRGKGGSQRK